MLDMMFRLFPFALNKQICSQQEESGSRKVRPATAILIITHAN